MMAGSYKQQVTMFVLDDEDCEEDLWHKSTSCSSRQAVFLPTNTAGAWWCVQVRRLL